MAECMSLNVCVPREHAEREEEEEGRRDKRGEGGERMRGVRRQRRDERNDGESMRAASERNDSFHAWDGAL